MNRPAIPLILDLDRTIIQQRFNLGHHLKARTVMTLRNPHIRAAWLVSAALVAALALFGCANHSEEPEDACRSTEQTAITAIFRFHFLITTAENAPYTGSADFLVYDFYCSGAVSGQYEDHTSAVVDGAWTPLTTRYTLTNSKDAIHMEFTTPTSDYKHDYYYDYVQAHMKLDQSQQYVFDDTIRVHLQN